MKKKKSRRPKVKYIKRTMDSHGVIPLTREDLNADITHITVSVPRQPGSRKKTP